MSKAWRQHDLLDGLPVRSGLPEHVENLQQATSLRCTTKGQVARKQSGVGGDQQKKQKQLLDTLEKVG